MKYIDAGWRSYAQLLPPNASETQIRETRQAFFAGAAVLFETLMHALDSDAEPTAADMERMDAIARELREFGQQIDRRYLGPTQAGN